MLCTEWVHIQPGDFNKLLKCCAVNLKSHFSVYSQFVTASLKSQCCGISVQSQCCGVMVPSQGCAVSVHSECCDFRVYISVVYCV